MILISVLFALCALSGLGVAYDLEVKIEDMPMQGPKRDPEYVDKVWGGIDGYRKGEAVIQLNDDNFEHLTQAASGWTTGDWFVMFGAPWCEHCEEMMPYFNETARELKGEINVGYIDASMNPFSSLRFNITGYPTLLLLRQGRMYEFRGVRYWREMALFARLGYEKVPSREIPPAQGTFDDLVYRIQQYSGHLYRFGENNPGLFFASVVGGIVFGCMLPYGYILLAPMDPDFVIAKKAKTEQAGPRVWTGDQSPKMPTIDEDTKGEGEEKAKDGEESSSTNSSSENVAGFNQVEVDADTVEIVTDANKTGSRKSKKSKKHQ